MTARASSPRSNGPSPAPLHLPGKPPRGLSAFLNTKPSIYGHRKSIRLYSYLMSNTNTNKVTSVTVGNYFAVRHGDSEYAHVYRDFGDDEPLWHGGFRIAELATAKRHDHRIPLEVRRELGRKLRGR